MLTKLAAVLLLASAAMANVVSDVVQALQAGNFGLADAYVARYRSAYGVTGEMLEAQSWIGRGFLETRQFDKADANAKEIQRLALEQLKRRRLDAEPHLPLALGAAIEVRARVLAARGDRNGALALLSNELTIYRTTSIATRLQKNINLLSLEGKAAPALDAREFLGPKPLPLASLRGKPVLLYFWAHWCGDCKEEEPILVAIQKEYANKGLVLIAPTQRYGYGARGEEAGPAAELKYMEQIRHVYLASLLSVPAPVSEANFQAYGASTVPTLVLIDRQGIVRLYHPGVMSLDQLRAALNRLG
jgi:thiol-disulfide isomerase/thioredoxin